MVMNVNDGVMPVLMTMPSFAGIDGVMLVPMVLIGMRVHVVVHRGLVSVRMNVRFVKQHPYSCQHEWKGDPELSVRRMLID